MGTYTSTHQPLPPQSGGRMAKNNTNTMAREEKHNMQKARAIRREKVELWRIQGMKRTNVQHTHTRVEKGSTHMGKNNRVVTGSGGMPGEVPGGGENR